MVEIKLTNASVEIPVFNATGRSLTSKLLEVATGGKLDSDPNGRIVVKALTNVSFTMREGDRVGFVGHNGAGKSTLLRVLSRVFEPTSGSASIVGQTGSLIDISLGINPEATGRENVDIRGQLLGLSKRQVKEKYEEIVSFAQLGDFMEMPVRTYSSGMQLRLAFAVSTIARPEILIMDEWLSVGDEGFKAMAESRLREMVSQSKILAIASHSRDLIESVCNRVIWLEHGSVLMDGAVEEVLPAYFR
jgi:lipopolysaccharide transport system ATP-binding protein